MLRQQTNLLEEGREIVESLISDFEVCIEDCKTKRHIERLGDLCIRFCSLEKFINTMFYLG